MTEKDFIVMISLLIIATIGLTILLIQISLGQ
jgi:hypothetical protein